MGLMTKGAIPMIPGTFSIFAITSRYSGKSLEYLRTRTCAFTPRTFSRNSDLNPPVTLNTVESAVVPRATPVIANAVPTEMNARLRERMYRIARSNGNPIVCPVSGRFRVRGPYQRPSAAPSRPLPAGVIAPDLGTVPPKTRSKLMRGPAVDGGYGQPRNRFTPGVGRRGGE